MLDCIFESSYVGVLQSLDIASGAAPVYDAYAKPTGSFDAHERKPLSSDEPLFSFSSPDSGMFLWVKVHLQNHSDWVPNSDSISTLEHRLWTGKSILYFIHSND